MIKIALNGFGRIGRNVLRALVEDQHQRDYQNKIEIVAINDLAPTESNAHLLKYDTTHGLFNADIQFDQKSISVNGKTIPVFSNQDPAQLPWQELEVDIVMECTGFFRARDKADLHRKAGAKKILVSAPGKEMDATIVYGVNQDALKNEDVFISNASCTTNCLAHVAKAMHDSIGIESGLANTVHAYTSTQNLLDSFHKDKRRGRAANQSMIPTSTGSAKAIGEVIPELDGKLDAVAVRVPTINVSLLDFTFVPTNSVDLTSIDEIFKDYAKGREGIFEVNEEPLVSVDFNHNSASCIVDSLQTRIENGIIKIQAWYDNEWAFSNRMLDNAIAMGKELA